MRYRSNRQGLRELLQGGIAQNLVRQHTDRLTSAAGDGFEGSTQQGKNRYRGIVYPDSWSAKRRNAKQNTLVRVLG